MQWYEQGLQPEEFANRIGHLTLAQVHAGPAYDPANREAIEADRAEEHEPAASDRSPTRGRTAAGSPGYDGRRRPCRGRNANADDTNDSRLMRLLPNTPNRK